VKERDERKENMLMKNIHEFADSGTQEKQRLTTNSVVGKIPPRAY
jgi:hypothetical protein